MDRLEEMLTRQRALQENAYGVPLGFMPHSPAKQMDFIRVNVLAAVAELMEALDEVDWKPWVTNPERPMDVDKVISELVDVQHFIFNVMIASGLSAEELAKRFFTKYVEKNERNAERQAEGYDGKSTKCPHCSRALDDVGVAQSTVMDTSTFECGHCHKSIPLTTILNSPLLQKAVRAAKIMNQS